MSGRKGIGDSQWSRLECNGRRDGSDSAPLDDATRRDMPKQLNYRRPKKEKASHGLHWPAFSNYFKSKNYPLTVRMIDAATL